MALANMRDLLRQADAQKRAVGAFNVSTIEMMCGVVKAAEELQTPVILQVAQIRLATTPLPLLGRAMYEAHPGQRCLWRFIWIMAPPWIAFSWHWTWASPP